MFLKYLAKLDLILILFKCSGQIGIRSSNVLCSIQQFDRSDCVNGKRPYGPVLLEDETGVTGENLWCFVTSNWKHSPHMQLKQTQKF